MTRKTAAVVNPKSASGRTGRMWREVAPRLGAVEPYFTSAPGHATDIARRLASEGYSRIIAVGGDGTVHEVINGLMDGGRPVAPGLELAVLPLGTGSDFQKSLGIGTLAGAIALLESGREATPTDVGMLDYTTHAGDPASCYFANLVSFGMGGEVASRARNFLSPISGKAAFLWATAEVALRYRPRGVTLSVDCQVAGRQSITNIAIGNGRFHGGGMHVCPLAALDDGQLEVTVIDALSLFELVRDLRVLYSDNLYRHPKTRHLRGRVIEAESPEAVSIEVDGEPLGRLPVRARLAPSKLPVLRVR